MLTEQGEQLYQTAKEIFAKLAMAEAMLVEGRETPKGPLKVTTTVAFGSQWLTPRLKNFLDLYPEITLTLILDDDDLERPIVGPSRDHDRRPRRLLPAVLTGSRHGSAPGRGRKP